MAYIRKIIIRRDDGILPRDPVFRDGRVVVIVSVDENLIVDGIVQKIQPG